MPWVDVGGTDLYYIEEGRGQPLVFLHGMSSCAEAWFQQFAFFRGRYRVIAYDSVNHGHSTNSPRGQEEPDRADELQGFLEALGIERPVLIGNSMGGNTILRWAVRHPDRAAALVVAGMGILTEGAIREVARWTRRLSSCRPATRLPRSSSVGSRACTSRGWAPSACRCSSWWAGATDCVQTLSVCTSWCRTRRTT